MTNPADQARRALGLPTTGGAAATASSGRARSDVLGIGDILSRSSSKTDAPASGLGTLTRLSWGATALAFAVAATYRGVTQFAAGTSFGPITPWVTTVLTIANAPTWAPWVSAAVGAVLVGLACGTSGFTTATRQQILAVAAADIAAMVLALPVVLALAAGILVVVLALVVVFLLVGLLIVVAMS